jgi:hypothetical protein
VKSEITYENHYICFPGGMLPEHQATVNSFVAEHCGQAPSLNFFFTDAGQQVRVGRTGDRWPISCGNAIEWRTDHPWTLQEVDDWWHAHCAPQAVGTFSDYTPAQRKQLFLESLPPAAPKPGPRTFYAPPPQALGPGAAPPPTPKLNLGGSSQPFPGWVASTSCGSAIIYWDHVPTPAEVSAWACQHCGQTNCR